MRKFIVFLMVVIISAICVSCGNNKSQEIVNENDTIIEEMVEDTVEILEDSATVIYQEDTMN